MSITRRSGSFSAVTIVLALVVFAAATALVGCGGTVESPGGPSGTGMSEASKALVVPEAQREPITAALTAAGIGGDPLYVYMNYGSSAKNTVVVTGQLKREGAALSKVIVAKSGEGWAVASAQ